MNYMKKTLLLAGVASLFAVNTANAEVKPYVGLDYNYSSYGMDKPYNDAFEDDYNSLSFVAGAKLMENFGLEAFYQRSLNEKNTYDGDNILRASRTMASTLWAICRSAATRKLN